MILLRGVFSPVVGVTMSRLKVPFAEFSYIEPGLSTKQPLSLFCFTSLAKHLALLFKIRMFGMIDNVANCCARPMSTLTLSDGGFRG